MHFEKNDHVCVRMFDVKDIVHMLVMDLTTDATSVINENGEAVGVMFDSSTNAYYKGKRIGRIRIAFDDEKQNLHFIKYTDDNKEEAPFDTGISQKLVECYLDAEVVIFKHLIETGVVKIEKENVT